MPDDALVMRDCVLDSDKIALFEGATYDTSEATYLTSRIKRTVDVAGALLVLALVLPLLFFVALVIVATSPGGVLYRQRRFGRDKRVFHVYKLRSMRAAENDVFKQAVRGDARVTWIGRIIRKTSIDEIPQLLNVLKGEMSLVGPRPHPVELDEQYSASIVSYETRFRALPGVTGLAQVSGARGGTPTVEHMRKRIAYDQHYVREASLVLDLKILAWTFKELLFALSDDNAF